jgi:uncharacterized repeat protein (TIGR01451 family)
MVDLGLGLAIFGILVALWAWDGCPVTAKLGVSLLLAIGLFCRLMTRWIRLRAWFLTGLMVATTIGSINLEMIFSAPSLAASENIGAGAYIVDLGQATQTVANGLKPYGLIYELLIKKAIPVKWAINPAKGRDGIDFTAGAKSYKGGAFIIAPEYAAEAASTIATWTAQGVVVDGPLTAAFTAPIYDTLTGLPNAVLDTAKGSIAQAYYTNAGIPAAFSSIFGSFNTYRSSYPSGLNSCDDIYIMPHADPTWALHNYLINFNTTNKGFIWGACHAVSVLENLDDPGDADTLPNLNLLSTNQSLIPFGSHSAGVPAYDYGTTSAATPYSHPAAPTNLWAAPIMQFLGKIDDATNNGSEQIYLPKTGSAWRPETTIAVYDANQANIVAGSSPGQAAKLAFGPGFGNSNNGAVMYEGGHNHAAASAPDNIAAQRAFLNFNLLAGLAHTPRATVNVPSSIGKGETVNVSATVSGGNGPYSFQWSSSCGGTFANASAQNTTFTAPITTTTATCAIRSIIRDGCNHRTFGSSTPTITGPQADLAIVKTDNQTVAKQGAAISYTMTVTNNGPSTVNSLQITDDIPPAILNPLFTPSTGAFSSNSTTKIGTWTGLNLATGQSITLTLKGTVSTTATGNLVNTAIVAPLGGITDPNSTNDSSTDTDSIAAPTAAITVTKDDGVTQTNKDGTLVYTIRVTNTGPDPLTSLKLEDQIVTTKSPKGGTDVMDNLNLAVSSGTLSSVPTAFANNTTTSFTSNLSAMTWNNVNLAVGQSATLTMSGQVNVDEKELKLVNSVRLTPLGSAGMAIGSAVTASDPDDLIAKVTEVELQMTKSVTTSPLPAPGENITYTLVAKNNKNTATNAAIADNIPTAIQNVTWTCSPTTGTTKCNQASGGVDANNRLSATANIANGGQVTYTVTGKVDPSFTGTLANTANVTPQPGDFDKTPNNNDGSVSSALVRKAALVVTKNDGLTTVAPGEAINYTIKVKNTGPSTINSVKLSDVIPTAIQNPTFGVSQGTFTPTKTSGTTTDTWAGDWTNLTMVPDTTNDTVTLTVAGTVSPTASGSLTNSVTIAAPATFTGSSYGATYTVDSTKSTLTASDTDTIQPLADLTVTKTDGKTSAVPGESVSYLITVTNKGPSTVTSLNVTDTVPSAISTPIFTASEGTYNSTTGNWTGLNLAANQSITLILDGTVQSTATGTLSNTVTVTPPTGVIDPNCTGSPLTCTGNNIATDTDTLTPQADLSITKSDGVSAVNPNTSTTYTIQVTNTGPSNATGVSVTDVIPTDLGNPTSTDSNFSYNSGTKTATWTGIALASGQSTTLKLTATVSSTPSGTTIDNTAKIVLPIGLTDPNLNNNSATDSDKSAIPTGTVDLSVTKTDGQTTAAPGSSLTYTIEVTNKGPGTIDNLTLTEQFPTAKLDTPIYSATDGTYDPTTSQWTDLNLLPNTSVKLFVDATVRSDAIGQITNTVIVAPPVGFTDSMSGNNSSTDDDIVPVVTSSPNILLFKRITAINNLTQNPNDKTPLGTKDNTTETRFPTDYLVGATAAGKVKPGDEIEYTIYYLNKGDNPAKSVRICDRLDPNLSFQPNTIKLQLGTSAPTSLTDANDPLDRAQFVNSTQPLPTKCNFPSGITTNPSGTVLLDLTGTTGTPNLSVIPGGTGSPIANNAYGFFKFKVKVK